MINIESLRKVNDTNRLVFNSNLSFEIEKNDDNSSLDFDFDFIAQYRSVDKKNSFYFIGNTSHEKTNNIEISNSGMGHLRYNRHFNDLVRGEIFFQMQTDIVLDLKSRTLFGTGPRFDLLRKRKLKLSLGSIYMLERERLIKDISHNVIYSRWSSYLTIFYYFPEKKGKFSTVTYLQPRFDKFEDYRFVNLSELSLNMNSKLALMIKMEYEFDAAPPKGINQKNMDFKVGLKVIL